MITVLKKPSLVIFTCLSSELEGVSDLTIYSAVIVSRGRIKGEV